MTREWHELREGPMHRLRSASTRPLPPLDASELASLSERMEHLAYLVTEMPDRELTERQKSYLRVIARELLRRANA